MAKRREMYKILLSHNIFYIITHIKYHTSTLLYRIVYTKSHILCFKGNLRGFPGAILALNDLHLSKEFKS